MLDYRSMTLDELADYVNEQLKSGRNLTKIAKEDFGVNESTIRKRLTKDNMYKRTGNEYVRQCQTNEDEKGELHNVRQSGRQVVTHTNTEQLNGNIKIISQTASQSVTRSIDNKKYNNLIDNYDIIMQMIEDYKKAKEHGSSSFNGLVVELPAEKKKDFRVTLRVNDVIYEAFKEFADANKQFTVKELVSQALKEFIDKYK